MRLITLLEWTGILLAITIGAAVAETVPEKRIQEFMGRDNVETSQYMPVTRPVLCDTKQKMISLLQGVGMTPLFFAKGGTTSWWFTEDHTRVVEATEINGKVCLTNMVKDIEFNQEETRRLLNEFSGLPVKLEPGD